MFTHGYYPFYEQRRDLSAVNPATLILPLSRNINGKSLPKSLPGLGFFQIDKSDEHPLMRKQIAEIGLFALRQQTAHHLLCGAPSNRRRTASKSFSHSRRNPASFEISQPRSAPRELEDSSKRPRDPQSGFPPAL